jgi:hypothetical protein
VSVLSAQAGVERVRQQAGSETLASADAARHTPALHRNQGQPPVPLVGVRDEETMLCVRVDAIGIPGHSLPSAPIVQAGRPASRVLRITLRATASGRP